MAPAGFEGPVGAAGAPGSGAAVADGDDGVDRGVGKDGSVGPASGEATGRPPMIELQPDTSPEPQNRATSSSEPPARPRRAVSDNRTRRSSDNSDSGTQVTHPPVTVAAFERLSMPRRW